MILCAEALWMLGIPCVFLQNGADVLIIAQYIVIRLLGQ